MCFRPPVLETDPVVCPECGSDVPDDTNTCQQCGATNTNQSNTTPPDTPKMNLPPSVPKKSGIVVPKPPSAPKPP